MEQKNMERVLQVTADGSHTLFIPEMNEHYHSVNGAWQESKYIFIEAGLHAVDKPVIHLLEIGFGTGLNALLTWKELEEVLTDKQVIYHSIELYPLSENLVSSLNYGELVWPGTLEPGSSIVGPIHLAQNRRRQQPMCLSYRHRPDLYGCFCARKATGNVESAFLRKALCPCCRRSHIGYLLRQRRRPPRHAGCRLPDGAFAGSSGETPYLTWAEIKWISFCQFCQNVKSGRLFLRSMDTSTEMNFVQTILGKLKIDVLAY